MASVWKFGRVQADNGGNPKPEGRNPKEIRIWVVTAGFAFSRTFFPLRPSAICYLPSVARLFLRPPDFRLGFSAFSAPPPELRTPHRL